MINFDKKLTAALMLALPMIGASYNAHATTVTFNTPTAGYNGPQYIGGPNQGDRINEIFTVPKGVTKMTVTVTGAGGGGGGGGGAYSIGVINSRASGGGGGGGGATVKCTFEPVKVERFYFGVADGGKEGPGGALEKNGDSGKGGQGDAYVYFFKDKGDGERLDSKMTAGNGSPGLGGPTGTATGPDPGGAGGAGGRGGVDSELSNCTIMDGEPGTAGGTNGPPQKAGAAGKAGSNACGAGAGGAGGEGGIINNSTYGGTVGRAGSKGANGCVTFEY